MRKIILFVLFSLSCTHIFPEKMLIKYQKTQEDAIRYSYYYTLIDKILEETEKLYPDTEVITYKVQMNSSRLNSEAIKGDIINLIWSDAGHKDLDEGMIPIPIPLAKGILGYRIFLIRMDSQPLFSVISTLDELKKLKSGQGKNWGDIPILRHNGLEVVEGTVYDGLFKMLIKRKFDYFPRGINEIFFEYGERKENYPELHIEEFLCIHYQFPVLFYVSRSSPHLAERIKIGLEKMIEDGSLDSIFDSYYKEIIEKSDLKNRKIFEIENPFIPDFVPMDRKELWLEI